MAVGGCRGGGPPGSIPNPVVKPACADGTALVTEWESRSLPTQPYLFSCLHLTAASPPHRPFFFPYSVCLIAIPNTIKFALWQPIWMGAIEADLAPTGMSMSFNNAPLQLFSSTSPAQLYHFKNEYILEILTTSIRLRYTTSADNIEFVIFGGF